MSLPNVARDWNLVLLNILVLIKYTFRFALGVENLYMFLWNAVHCSINTPVVILQCFNINDGEIYLFMLGLHSQCQVQVDIVLSNQIYQ
jgi:hypothetical protein